ncbi:hypothetical protein B9Z55_028095 [Caenorhabditis nigoni]|uniref:Uncharacterized protein n=1 Tax=Caenorhabditis nigoni TaxID=1611254 RepID=A0A2G5SDA0_9PELO|nr:hypothetical protein B9Z55_028095 [Caenorhabditis nigoni]
MVQHSWATLDIEDEPTCDYINRMEINELERAKFEFDVLASNIDSNIKFLKAEDNPLPFVVKLRGPRERGNFNPQYQQSNNNWTRQNFAQEQNYERRADTYQAPQHFNRPMQQCFSGPFQTVPPSHAKRHFQSNQPNGDYYPSPTESETVEYTGSSSNGYEGSQNIQYIPASYPRDVPYATVIPPGESQIHDPSHGVSPLSAEFNYPMQQYYSGPSQAVSRLETIEKHDSFLLMGTIQVFFQDDRTNAPSSLWLCTMAWLQKHGLSSSHAKRLLRNILPNDGYYPSPSESRDSGVYTSSHRMDPKDARKFNRSDEKNVPALPSGMAQVHDPSPSRSRRQNAHRKKQTVNAKPRIQTAIKDEPNSERNPQTVSRQHEEPQLAVAEDNGKNDSSPKVSKDVSTLPVALENLAESLESSDFDAKEIEKQDTSDEATVTVAKQEIKPPSIGTPVEDNIQTTTELVLEKKSSIVTDDVSVASTTDLNCDASNLKSVQAMERSDVDAKDSRITKFVVEAKLLPSIETTVKDNIRTTTEFELEKESPIVTDNVSGASNRDLNCELSKLDEPVQSTETTEFDAERLKDQFTSDEATLTLLPHAHDSAKFVVEAKLRPIIKTAKCYMNKVIEFEMDMKGRVIVQQHKEPQKVVDVDTGKKESRLQIGISKDVDTRPSVVDDMSGASNTGSDRSKLEKPLLSTPMTPIDSQTKELKGKITDDRAADQTTPNSLYHIFPNWRKI